MKVGIPKEIKNHEYRVGMTPNGVRELVAQGHQVLVENNAGAGIGFDNDDYIKAGASIYQLAADIYRDSDMIVKVKEPQPSEYSLLRAEQILFTYLHLAADRPQTEALIQSKATCIAYETITDDQGKLPLLAPMSEVAGRMSIQAGAHSLERAQGGSGVLLGGVTGVKPAEVVIIGGGVVGVNAARMAVGARANVTLLDSNIAVLRELDCEFKGQVNLIYATQDNIERYVLAADLVIGAVLVRGAAAPKIIDKDLVKRMKKGAAIVDVAIDQGGISETSRATTHAAPTYNVDGVVHYCVANMPGAVAKTASEALTNATLPYVVKLANLGAVDALLQSEHFLNGLNVYQGRVTLKEVADTFGLPYFSARQLLS